MPGILAFLDGFGALLEFGGGVGPKICVGSKVLTHPVAHCLDLYKVLLRSFRNTYETDALLCAKTSSSASRKSSSKILISITGND